MGILLFYFWRSLAFRENKYLYIHYNSDVETLPKMPPCALMFFLVGHPLGDHLSKWHGLCTCHHPTRHSTWIYFKKKIKLPKHNKTDSEIYSQILSSLFNQTLTPKTHVLSSSFIGTTHLNLIWSIKNLFGYVIPCTHFAYLAHHRQLQSWDF